MVFPWDALKADNISATKKKDRLYWLRTFDLYNIILVTKYRVARKKVLILL